MASLGVTFAGLELRNPILSASGTFGHGLEMRHIVSPGCLGGLVSKTVTLAPRAGNPMPRICETNAGFLNSIGLENRGLAHYLEHVVPEVADADTLIITNLGGESVEAYAELASALDERPEIDAFELNLSCPNVDGGRLRFSTEPSVTEAAVRAVREATTKPVLAKLSPNVTRIDEIARAAEAGGADGITAINTVLGMGVDWRSRRPSLNTVVGGYSGVAILPIALRCAHECVQAVDIPVVGCGGICSASDVLEFLVVGCSAVQVGTSNFSDPSLLAALPDEVGRLLDEQGIASVEEVIGSLLPPDSTESLRCASIVSRQRTSAVLSRSSWITLGHRGRMRNPSWVSGNSRAARPWMRCLPVATGRRRARPRPRGTRCGWATTATPS
jgi:dihydroorotate dehydrogenase (NAD+) catalytic subunit